MITGLKILDESGKEVLIDIIMNFKIEELGKEYIVFTVNDDGVSEKVNVSIAELKHNAEGIPSLGLIPKAEMNVVLSFYDSLRDYFKNNEGQTEV